MKALNKVLIIGSILFFATACYEEPNAPIDDLIAESFGSVPVAADYSWVGDDPAAGGQVSFTFNFWSDTDIEAINMYSSTDGGTTLVLEQTNNYGESGYSEFYSTDTLAYAITIPASVVAGSSIEYRGEVVNTNGNTATRSISFDVQ